MTVPCTMIVATFSMILLVHFCPCDGATGTYVKFCKFATNTNLNNITVYLQNNNTGINIFLLQSCHTNIEVLKYY